MLWTGYILIVIGTFIAGVGVGGFAVKRRWRRKVEGLAREEFEKLAIPVREHTNRMFLQGIEIGRRQAGAQPKDGSAPAEGSAPS